MSLQYIFGGSGSGKTEYCLKEIIKKQEERTDGALVYLVPEQFSLESEKNLLLKSKNLGMIEVQVLSFNRLAYHVFSQNGFTNKKLLDELGKKMLLRKATYDLKKSLNFFGKNIDKQGFIDNLSELITEFHQYSISWMKLNELSESLKDSQSLSLKLKDLSIIYKTYCEILNEQYIQTDQTLDILSEKISDSDYLDGSRFWLDAFYGFTVQEYNVIYHLLKKSEKINITFNINDNKIFYPNLTQNDFLYEIKNTINKLTNMAEKIGVKIETPIFLNHKPRFINAMPLKFLEENFWNTKAIFTGRVDEHISILSAANHYEEITNTAEEIISFVRDKGLRFSDIGVITNDLTTYEKGIEGIFSNYEIPFFVDSKANIVSHPLTELIRAAVDVVVSNWSYVSVFRFLKTSLTGIEREDIDVLENYVLKFGIKNYKWKLEQWLFGFNGESEEKVKINEIKTEVVKALEPFTINLTKDKALTVKDFSFRIYDMLEKLCVKDTLSNWINEATLANDNVMLRMHKQIWDKILQVFDKMVEILGDEKVTAKEFAKILDAGFLDTDMGSIPPSQEQVVIGDLERSILPNLKALFVLGVNEGVLPKVHLEKGFLNDDDRQALEFSGLDLALDRRRLIIRDQFLIYETLTKPANYLRLSYCQGTLDGKTMSPSAVIVKIKKMFKDVSEVESKNVKTVSLPNPMFSQMGSIIRHSLLLNKKLNGNEALYAWFSNSSIYAPKLEKMKNILIGKMNHEKLNKESINKLYGKDIITSVSRLERYVACPFSYFVQYNLEATERNVYQVDSLDVGNLFHIVLEEFMLHVAGNKIGFENLTKKDIDLITEQCVEKIIPTLKEEILLSTAAHKYIANRVKRVSKKSIWALCKHINQGDFLPIASEFEFNRQLASPMTGIIVAINKEHNFILSGKIDRIDIMDKDGNRYVKIIDYKSGNKQFDFSDIYFGMQLQLILYLDAFIKLGEKFFDEQFLNLELKPGGVLYFNINDPIINSENIKCSVNDEAFREELDKLILKEFKMSGLVLNAPDVIIGMDREINSYSQIIPVQVKGMDSEMEVVKSRSKVADLGEFNKLRDFVLGKVKEIGEDILAGNIKAYPFKKGDLTGCTYCSYSSICGIDALEAKNKFKKVNKVKDLGDFVPKPLQGGPVPLDPLL